MTGPLRIGVVGCGEIAQVAHLPLLTTMSEFEVVAVADVSPALVDQVGERFRVRRRYTEVGEMIAAGDLDAVAILNMDHTAAALAAIDAGLHVLVEKPLAFTVEECREIDAAARRAGVTLLVGYMRQHDPLYAALRREMATLGRPRMVRMRDAGGDFSLHGRVFAPIQRDDAGRGRRRADIDRKLIGEVGEAAAALYESMLMLCSHDVAMLRGLLGGPREILACTPIGGEGLVCLLEHGGGETSLFEGDIGALLPGWDQRVTVRGDTGTVELVLGNPYLTQVPTTLQSFGSAEADEVAIGIRKVVADPFRRQWRHFRAVVDGCEATLAGGREATLDVELLAELSRLAAPAGRSA